MTYPITGIKAGLGPGDQVPVRREIDEWWSSKDKNDVNQRSLFIYALHDFMTQDPDDQLSYFGVAGIHGQPLIPWDTISPKKGDYCVHGTPLFPPWHRPYLLLYEQRLYEIMLKLIPTTFAAQDQNDMIRAAQTWRLPFWDWAMKKPDWHQPSNLRAYGPNVPYIITQPKVQVKTKTGFAEVDNPMWKFTVPANNASKTVFGDFGITDDGRGHPYDLAKSTSRHPSTFDPDSQDFNSAWVDGDAPDWDVITGELRGSRAIDSNTLPEAVYRLFLEDYMPTYNDFATDGYTPAQSPSHYSSLEDIHGQLHVFTGGAGQMGSVPVAAFDPIFWLHHCNVDRIFALWQELYPNKYVTPFRLGRGGPRLDANTGLLPFHKTTTSDLWSSSACRYLKDCGYAYPETQKWLPAYKTNGVFDLAKYQRALRASIDNKYSTTATATLQLAGNDDKATTVLAHLTTQSFMVQNVPATLLAKAPEVKARTDSDGTHKSPEPVAVVNGEVSAQATVAVHAAAATALAAKEVPAQAPIAVHAAAAPAPAVKDVSAPAPIAAHAAAVPAAATQAPIPPVTTSAQGEKWEENDYIVNVLYDRFALNGNPYLVRIFLGDVPQGPPFYFSDTPTQIGLVYNFSGTSNARGTGMEGCANCIRQKEEKELSTGQVVLTDYLVEHIKKGMVDRGVTLESMDREDVVAYLQKNLHWRISDSKDVLIPKETMPSLKISVAMGKATHFADASKFSKYENYEVLWDVSDGRLAGASPGDLD